MAAQQGFVSIQHQIREPLEEQYSECTTNVVHIELPSAARKEFQDILYQLGMRRRSIFPEIDAMFGSYESERLIHDRLCDDCRAHEFNDEVFSIP